MRILLVGAAGRMGIAVKKCAPEFKTVILQEASQKGDLKKINAKGVDAVIDFSGQEGFSDALRWSMKNKIPFISGSTGLSKKDFSKIAEAQKTIPLFWSPNMSIGVNVAIQALRAFAHVKEWDFGIHEVHHSKKKDAPSGTALLLANALEAEIGKEILATSHRGGTVVGEHTVSAYGPDEVIEIKHTAFSRDIFARGAIQAALWVRKKKPGFYNMSDMLRS